METKEYVEAVRLIGLCAIGHSSLNYFLEQLAFRLAHSSPAYLAPLVGNRTTKARLDSLQRLIPIQPFGSAQMTTFNDFISAAREANTKRNKVLHGLWALDQSGRLQRIGDSVNTLYGKGKPDFEKLSQLELDHLRALNKEFDRLIEEALNLYAVLQDAYLKAIRENAGNPFSG